MKKNIYFVKNICIIEIKRILDNEHVSKMKQTLWKNWNRNKMNYDWVYIGLKSIKNSSEINYTEIQIESSSN